MLKFKTRSQEQEQGFTLVEVLVAILITTVFVATAMQAVVIAAIFKARAKQFTEATNWIQQDLERVRQQASIVGYTTLSAAPTSTGSSSSLPVSSTTGFSASDKVQISTISNIIYTVGPIPGNTNTITVTPALTAAQLSATPVSTPVSVVTPSSTNTTLCNANAQNNGFGNFLSSNLPTLNSSNNTKTIAGVTYTLSRSTTVRDVAPYEVLEINYSVAQGTNSPIAKLTTQVIPNAAFQCPPY